MAHQLDDRTLVSPQIAPEDVVELKRQGVTMIVNNRPDHEDPGQPLGADIEAAAREAGIEYRYAPIARGMGPSDVEAMIVHQVESTDPDPQRSDHPET